MVSGDRSLDGLTGWKEESLDGNVVLAVPRDRGMENALRPSMGAKGGGLLPLLLLPLPPLLLFVMLLVLVVVEEEVEDEEEEDEEEAMAEGDEDTGEEWWRMDEQGPPDSQPRHLRHLVSALNNDLGISELVILARA